MTHTDSQQQAVSQAPPHTSRREGDVERDIARVRSWSNAELVGRTITIDKPRAELYAFWRNLSNLAFFMENIERIDVLDERRSHWVVKGPTGDVEWDAEITEDQPERLLAWRSLEGASVKHDGRVEFRDGPPGRGSEMEVVLAYEAPGGDVGKIIAKAFQKEPQVQARRDMRRFKQLMETGEVTTTEPPYAAPRAN